MPDWLFYVLVSIASAVVAGLVVWLYIAMEAAGVNAAPMVTGKEGMVGKTAIVKSIGKEDEGQATLQVFLEGTLWTAVTTRKKSEIKVGDKITVNSVDGLKLTVG